MVWVAALEVWLTACIASAAARPSDCVASEVLTLIVLASCSMRALSASAAALVRTSICSVTCSARPISSCSKRPMRVSGLLATSTARGPSARSICTILWQQVLEGGPAFLAAVRLAVEQVRERGGAVFSRGAGPLLGLHLGAGEP